MSLSSEKFTTCLENFEKNIEEMETKVKNLEDELHNVVLNIFSTTNNCEKVEIFKQELSRLSESEQLLQQEVNSMSSQIKALQTENEELLEELKLKNDKIQSYRQKYLDALERCEERSCELTALKNQELTSNLENIFADLEFENESNVLQKSTSEIKSKQIEIDEVRSILKVKHNTIETLSKDLEACIQQSETQTCELENERIANKNLLTQISKLRQKLDEQILNYKQLVAQRQVTEKQNIRIQQLEDQLDEKQKELEQFEQHLNLFKEESAKQIIRTKERAETQKNALQTQVTDLEKELALTHALLNSTTKCHNEPSHAFNSEILKLEGKLNEAHVEIQHFRNNINLLNCSHSNISETFDEDDTTQNIELHVTNVQDTNMTDDKRSD